MYALSKLKCTFECENDISTIGAASGEEYTYISEANGSLSVLLFFVCVCVRICVLLHHCSVCTKAVECQSYSAHLEQSDNIKNT